VQPSRFRAPGDPFEGYWVTPPSPFGHLPEDEVTKAETLNVVAASIRSLPARQQQVITLRDIEGWSAQEVCSWLDLTEANQRVLLHRARARVRSALEEHFADERAS
jgi:RNA polymerase sigma-70 factor (ECF subfamily)